jgi:centromeric protein E
MSCCKKNREFIVRVSYIEIYNEVISDLVADKQKTLRIHEDAARGVYVGGLTEQECESAEQALEFMRRGEARRHVSATRMNDQSSRSHTLFRVSIESRARLIDADAQKSTTAAATTTTAAASATTTTTTKANAAANGKLQKRRGKSRLAAPKATAKSAAAAATGDVVRISQLNLVDLAGSERVRDTGSAGQQLREGGHINKSLLTLGTVIGKLADLADATGGGGGGAPHIPYRDSKLTRILQTCLGGNARTAVVCTVTPARCHVDESLSTLKFGMSFLHCLIRRAAQSLTFSIASQ